MLVYIVKKFDKREVGEQIDLHESIAKILIEKGFAAETMEVNENAMPEAKRGRKKQ